MEREPLVVAAGVLSRREYSTMTVADRQTLDAWSADIVGNADAATIARHRERWRAEIEFIFSVQLDTSPDHDFRACGVSRLRPVGKVMAPIETLPERTEAAQRAGDQGEP